MPYLLAGAPIGAAGGGGECSATAVFDPRPFDLAMVAPRSAMPERTTIVLIALGVPLALVALGFALLGAWPVLMFSGLDLLLLAAALHVFRRREVPSERLVRDGATLIHIVRDGSGREDRVEFPAYWTRLIVADGAAMLRFRNRSRPVGACLGATERRELIAVLHDLLPDRR